MLNCSATIQETTSLSPAGVLIKLVDIAMARLTWVAYIQNRKRLRSTRVIDAGVAEPYFTCFEQLYRCIVRFSLSLSVASIETSWERQPSNNGQNSTQNWWVASAMAFLECSSQSLMNEPGSLLFCPECGTLLDYPLPEQNEIICEMCSHTEPASCASPSHTMV